MRANHYRTIFVLACILSGCVHSPHRPKPGPQAYWDDPRWQLKMLNAVQSVIHAPASIPAMSTPGIHGTVRFLFINGIIENPMIVSSTGDTSLDKLLLQQVASAKVPAPTGPHANEPREFEVPLDMPTPFESFEYAVYAAVDYQKHYTKEAVIQGYTGVTAVDFDYFDAKAHNIKVARSSGNSELDKSSVNAVINANLPPSAPDHTGTPLHMEVIFCYSFNNTKGCPSGKNVIEVTGTRIRRSEIYR